MFFFFVDKKVALQQPPPALKALTRILPHGPHSNQAPLPSMEERGREAAVTSRRRKGAGQARGGVVRSGFELLTHQLGGARQGGAGVEASPAAWRKVVVGAGRTM